MSDTSESESSDEGSVDVEGLTQISTQDSQSKVHVRLTQEQEE